MTITDDGALSFDDAFAALFRHAYSVALRILGSQPDAEDVAIGELRRRRRRPLVTAAEPVSTAASRN
jgi:hypothetical protein